MLCSILAVDQPSINIEGKSYNKTEYMYRIKQLNLPFVGSLRMNMVGERSIASCSAVSII